MVPHSTLERSQGSLGYHGILVVNHCNRTRIPPLHYTMAMTLVSTAKRPLLSLPLLLSWTGGNKGRNFRKENHCGQKVCLKDVLLQTTTYIFLTKGSLICWGRGMNFKTARPRGRVHLWWEKSKWSQKQKCIVQEALLFLINFKC